MDGVKYFIKRDSKVPHKCSEVCPFLNDGKLHIDSYPKIGSGFCQSDCEDHKNNNLIEEYGTDYSVSQHGGRLVWIECDKLKEIKKAL